MNEEKNKGLCYRCEHRARFLESGHGPRCECGDIKSASYSCYMYEPVKPIVQEVNPGDRRPIGAGWMISPRAHRVEDTRVEFVKMLTELPRKRGVGKRFFVSWIRRDSNPPKIAAFKDPAPGGQLP